MKIDFKKVRIIVKPTIIFLLIVFIYSGICFGLLNSEKHWTGIDFSNEEENNSSWRYYEYLYFACTTYSTAGYGDIYPKSIASRALTLFVQLSMIIGIVSLI
jgi:hypothetical protein